MSAFEAAFARTIQFEGGFSDDPNDPGGATKYGISSRSYPDLDVRTITLEQAKAIYLRDFWEPASCDRLNDPEVAAKVFDLAVNCGIRKAGEILQRAINFLIRHEAEVSEDGVIGPSTIHAAEMCNQRLLLLALRGEQYVHYRALVQSKNTTRFETFAGGWLRRSMA